MNSKSQTPNPNPNPKPQSPIPKPKAQIPIQPANPLSLKTSLNPIAQITSHPFSNHHPKK